jgi:N-acetylmuramoyl-L-alanine amidase CwlA
MRNDTPQVGYAPYRQVHLHSTGNANSTAQNEASYMKNKDLNTGFFNFIVGNGKVYQTAPVGRGAWDVGGDWNYETYAAIEIIESHKSKEEFIPDYKLYIQLAAEMVRQGGIAHTLDTPETDGVKTHNYASRTGHGSDHVDPLPYLAKWGITFETLKIDLMRAIEGGSDVAIESGEAVAQKNGKWYLKNKKTGQITNNLAHGIVAHMGNYWVFNQGIIVKNQFVSQWGNVYWATGDGIVASGTGEYAGMKFDFGDDGTYFVKNIKIVNGDLAAKALNSMKF